MGANHVIFNDRAHAGLLLSEHLGAYAGKSGIILGLARGGVVTAKRIATILSMPVDVLVVKKIPSPTNEELAIGAVAPDGVVLVHWPDAHRVGADEDWMNSKTRQLTEFIRKQLRVYRKGKKPLSVEGKLVILVDDGAATGSTMEAAILWARKKKAREIVVALPVASVESAAMLQPEVDALIIHHRADRLDAVGQYYTSFGQVEDQDVVSLVR